MPSKVCKRRRNNQNGNLLVEVLIAMLVAAIFSAAVLQMYVQTFSLSDQSQDQIMAAAIAQECIDALRALPYNTVANAGPTHYALVSGSEASVTDGLFPRPLLLDTTAFQYSQGPSAPTATGLDNRFQVVNNQVQVNVSAQSASTLLINVQLTYSNGSGTHTYNTYTILVRNGLNS